jgi:hypothetical protein
MGDIDTLLHSRLLALIEAMSDAGDSSVLVVFEPCDPYQNQIEGFMLLRVFATWHHEREIR